MSNSKTISPVEFDVLVIYSDLVAQSAIFPGQEKPFKNSFDKFNDVYAYLLEKCEEAGLTAAFSTTGDISGSGICSSYWIYKKNKWMKVSEPCCSRLIFDKFFPKNSVRKLQREQMFLSPNVKSFTSNSLLELFFDKFQTYSELSKYSVPTVRLTGRNKVSINRALTNLKKMIAIHLQNEDFGENIIMKDRYGSGGNHVYSISSNFTEQIFGLLKSNNRISFIMQPQVAFEKGYQYKNYEGATEIRLIYHGEKIVQCYIRVASDTDFICNNGGGGIWISQNEIPNNVKRTANKIARNLNKKNAIFALDFIISDNGNVYLLEANVSPGIDWYEDNPRNKKMNQAMIDIIAKELSRRVGLNKANSEDTATVN